MFISSYVGVLCSHVVYTLVVECCVIVCFSSLLSGLFILHLCRMCVCVVCICGVANSVCCTLAVIL